MLAAFFNLVTVIKIVGPILALDMVQMNIVTSVWDNLEYCYIKVLSTSLWCLFES